MTAVSDPCITRCKAPTYYLHELFFTQSGQERNKVLKIYRDRAVIVNGEPSYACVGEENALKVFLHKNYFCYKKRTEENQVEVRKISKIFWDRAWRPLQDPGNLTSYLEYDASLSIPCTCTQPELSLGEIADLLQYSNILWAYRDRPVVSYQQGSTGLIPQFDFSYCGIAKRVKIFESSGRFFVEGRDGFRAELDPSFIDLNWKVYLPSKDGKLETFADENLLGANEKKKSEKKAEKSSAKKEENAASSSLPSSNSSIPAKNEQSGNLIEPAFSGTPPSQTASSQLAISNTVVSSSSRNDELSSQSFSQDATSSATAPVSSHVEVLPQQQALSSPSPKPENLALQQVQIQINDQGSNDHEDNEKQSNWCQRICCCFKKCFPSYFQ